jgi:hypothetical protein
VDKKQKQEQKQKTKTTAGPSTAFGAKYAPNFAQDDRFLGCAIFYRPDL